MDNISLSIVLLAGILAVLLVAAVPSCGVSLA
jgi:hypothetical protein